MATKVSKSRRKASGQRRTTKPKLPAKAANQSAETEVSEPRQLASSWQLSRRAIVLLKDNWQTFGILLLVYLALDLLLVRGLSLFNISALQSSVGGSHGLTGSFAIFTSLFAGTSGSGTSAAGAYQFFELVIISLVMIYVLRQLLAESAPTSRMRVKLAFYQSTFPLVPFVLVLLLIGVQLLPLGLGATLYSVVVGGGIAIGVWQQSIFLLILLALAALSLFWLTRSVIALYIVTLPDMTPLKAFRSAKPLVQGRRLSVARKLVFLPVVMFVLAAAITVPCILIWAPLARWVFYLLTLIGLLVAHAYLYTLYRELLGDKA